MDLHRTNAHVKSRVLILIFKKISLNKLSRLYRVGVLVVPHFLLAQTLKFLTRLSVPILTHPCPEQI